jgi:hypothetical protein
MQLLIKILVFVIFTQSLAKLFSIEDIRIDNDTHVLLVYKIAVTKQTTKFFSLLEIVILTQIRVAIKKLCNVVLIKKKRLKSLKCEHDDQSTRQHLQSL